MHNVSIFQPTRPLFSGFTARESFFSSRRAYAHFTMLKRQLFRQKVKFQFMTAMHMQKTKCICSAYARKKERKKVKKHLLHRMTMTATKERTTLATTTITTSYAHFTVFRIMVNYSTFPQPFQSCAKKVERS